MRKLLIAAIIGVAIAAPVGWFYGLPAYRHYKETRFLRLAQEGLTKGQYREAWLSARTVLIINRTNVDACRVLAELGDLARSPQAIVWRGRIAEIEPTLEHQLDLAACALRLEPRPYPVATATIEAMRETAAQSPQYHVIAAERALRLNRIPEAEAHLREARRLEPTNALHAVNLAVLGLKSTEPAAVNEAKEILVSKADDPRAGLVALRSLRAEAFLRQDWTAAAAWASRILTRTNALFADRVEYLSILHASTDGKAESRKPKAETEVADGGRATSGSNSEARSSNFETTLQSLKEMASTNLASIADLGNWLNEHDLATEMLKWARELPERMRQQQPVPLLMADAYVREKDWKTLQSWLHDQKWDDQDYLRLAILARAWREEPSGENVAKVNWSKAVRVASDRVETLVTLANTAQLWGWTNEVQEVLGQACKQYPGLRWASEALERSLYQSGNTRGLLAFYASQIERQPNDTRVMNNLATVSLLLQTNLPKAHVLAREAFQQNQTNPITVSTYAFSRYLQGQTGESLALMSKLPEQDLRQPGTAVYYAVLLAAAGDAQKAQSYRALAERASLLPEERALLGP